MSVEVELAVYCTACVFVLVTVGALGCIVLMGLVEAVHLNGEEVAN